MNHELSRLATQAELSHGRHEALRLAFGLACCERVKHLLEDPNAIDCLAVLRAFVDGTASPAAFTDATTAIEAVAGSHRGSNSIDGSAHAAVSATYAVANALAGRALEAASYAAYASVYSYGGYAVTDPSAFDGEFAWQVETFRALCHGVRARDPAGVTLRVAVASDALCIGVLATQVFLDTYAANGIRPSLAREVLENLSTDAIAALVSKASTTFIVAEAAQHMVGFAQLTSGSTHALVGPEGSVELNRLYVHRRFAGKGIGRTLLRRAEVAAASQGASTLWLTAWVGNPPALAFYPSQGYRELGATPYVFEGEEFENRVFAKPLPS